MWISVWITFNKNSNDYYYCFSNLPKVMLYAYLHPPYAPYPCIVTAHYPACYPTCKNTQKASYTQKIYNNTILLWHVSMWGCIYIFRNGSLCPGWGCVQLTRQLQNCIKFSHNSPNHTKFTSIVTSIKY